MREQPRTSLAVLADEAADAIRPYLTRPFAFFGHSAGAVLAFEVARRLAYEAQPDALFVSARCGPGAVPSDPPFVHLPDDAFVREMERRYGGIPAAVRDSPEMLQMLLPILRADAIALAEYRYGGGSPLGCPVHALGGREDGTVTETELGTWADVTQGAFRSRMFDGGHFFVESARPQVLAYLSGELVSLTRHGGRDRAPWPAEASGASDPNRTPRP